MYAALAITTPGVFTHRHWVGLAVNKPGQRGPYLLPVAVATFATVAARRLRITSDLVSGVLLSHSFPLSASNARASHSAASARIAAATAFLTAAAAH